MSRTLQWGMALLTITCLCILSYAFVDIQTALWFHSLGKSRAYELFEKITLFGDSLYYLTGGLLLFVVFRKKTSSTAYLGLFLFSSVAASGLTADFIKYIGGRARPKLYFSDHIFGFDFFHWQYAWTSFPSGHSATAFSVATLISMLYPRWRFAAFFAALLIAFSRIFLSQHYISDVIAGSFLGIVSTILLYNHFFKSRLDASEPNKI
ncbi:MAG: phosphatase PAP2 family protein [Chlorobiaceae bacterium]|jgi:membrane-associated phospholipid phosphatase